MTWFWLLLICWGCLLAGFLFGNGFSKMSHRIDDADRNLYIQRLEEKVKELDDANEVLRRARQVEWERKIDAGGTP